MTAAGTEGRARIVAAELWPALVLGAAGYLLNLLELQLGWGLHFMFGNALVFAFVRVLRPQYVVLAGSISSLRSIFLWNHPWAWLIWTVEAGLVAVSARKTSPVRSDVIFWILIGTPLLILSYGLWMGMDRPSLLLVIAKQATNGVLNVVLGEIVYLSLISLQWPRRAMQWPRISIQSVVMTCLLAIILIPTVVYLRIDAPAREQAARQTVGDTLQIRLQIAKATIDMWTTSRSLALSIFASAQQGTDAARRAAALPPELSREFSGVRFVERTGRGVPGAASPTSAAASRLVALPGSGTDAQFILIVPSRRDDRAIDIVATIRPDVLQGIIPAPDSNFPVGTFMVSPASRIIPITRTAPALAAEVLKLRPEAWAGADRSAVLLSDRSYGNSLMSDLRDARIARSARLDALTDWQVVTIANLSPEVLKAREGQLQLFTALCGFVALITALGSLLGVRIARSLRQLAHSAADLAELGTRREKIDSLVISELDDISGMIASAGSSVLREHGALLNYQRRLNSIARHAPIAVYALEIRDRQKSELVYISETIEALLGYTRAEIAQDGWWSHAVHPEDYEHAFAAFSDLQPGRVVQTEYRLRHKRGHYIWIDDTLAVEVRPETGDAEGIGVLVDISERKTAAEQLLQADKMASLGRMIAGTAHELNQPLNFIKMATSNLREHARRGKLDPERFTAKLETILDHVARASAIILQMRIFGRTPSEAPAPMDIIEAIDAVLVMAAPQLELDGTRIDVSSCVAGVKVAALPIQLEQVLLNLLLNANDAIRTRRERGDAREGLIRISIEREGLRGIISIEDNGTGLSPDVLPMIFEPFFTTKPPKDGTGLGLPISYGIIRDLGGTIRAENTERGARFIIALPTAE